MTDIRFALRALLKRPGLTGLAVIVLALGIGVNAAVFAAVDRLLLRALPFENPERLVMIWGSNPALAEKLGLPDRLPVSFGVFDDWRRQARSFERLAILMADTDTLTGRGDPEVLGSVHVSGEFFGTLGARPLLGRLIAAADERPDAPPVAVLSHPLWQRRFGGDQAVLGQSVVLDGNPVTVVGVMPAAFGFPRGSEMPAGFGFRAATDVWRSIALTPERLAGRRNRSFAGIGRLNSGHAIDRANAEIATIATRQQKAFPDTDQGWGGRVEPLREQLVGDLRPPLMLLTIAGALVLLIGCANVASLLLVAGTARQREFAIRAALGATRAQIARQVLLESACLAVAGAACGLLLAAWSLPAIGAILPERVAHLSGLTLDWRHVLFTCGLSVLTALVFGTTPAMLATRTSASPALRDASRGGSSGIRGARARRRLVIAETALAVMLLVAAVLLARSFVRLMQTDAGFATEHITSFSLQLSSAAYGPERRVRFFEQVLDRIRSLPGVLSAGAVTYLPLTGTEHLEPIIIEHRPTPPDAPLMVDFRVVIPGYFDTLRIPLKEGRALEAADNLKDRAVAVIDETMARRFWPTGSAVGRRFRIGAAAASGPWLTVVGVVGGLRHAGLGTGPRPTIYVPHVQELHRRMTVVLRTRPDSKTTVADIRRAVGELDPAQPMTDIRTIEEIVALSAADRRFVMLLLAALAAAAFLLAAVGLFAVVAHTTALRTREVGIRIALGATPWSVRGLVLTEGLGLVALGLVCGLAGAAVTARSLAHWLYGVSHWDPVTFAVVPMLFVVVAAAACFVPARRATRVDPVTALRAE